MENSVLSTNCLTKKYGSHNAVDSVTLNVKKGDIYGFIGKNGAGKTTFMKMVCGMVKPTSGEISLFGRTGAESEALRSRIGALIEAPGLFANMTAADNLNMKMLALGIHKKGYAEEILSLVGLSDAGKKKTADFSMGMKQRLGIGLALVGEPDLLMLDEPINGLDPQGIAEVRETVLTLNRERGMTVMISSHILEELSKIATCYGIIDKGRLIKKLTKDELAAQCKEHIEIKLDLPEKACAVLDGMGVGSYKVTDKNTICVYEQLDRSGEINIALIQAGVKLNSIFVASDDIEKYFLDVTGGAENA